MTGIIDTTKLAFLDEMNNALISHALGLRFAFEIGGSDRLNSGHGHFFIGRLAALAAQMRVGGFYCVSNKGDQFLFGHRLSRLLQSSSMSWCSPQRYPRRASDDEG
jgi:hypothetical protein